MAGQPGGLDLLFEVGIQFIRFAAVGVIGTLGHYVVLVVLVHLVGSDPVLASAAGAAVGAILNYSLNYRFTFNSNEQHRIALPRFLIVMAVGFNLNLIIMYVGVDTLRIHYLVVQVFATGVVLLWNFTGNRLWTFKDDKFLRRKGKRNQPHAALADSCATDGGKGFRSWLSRLT
jgi:putative flippase GtrA